MQCPKCGSQMNLKTSDRFKYPSGQWRRYFKCDTTGCNTQHGAHPDGKPCGSAVDPGARSMRIKAHAALADLMRMRRWGKPQGYEWIAKVLRISPHKAHIGMLNYKQCVQLLREYNKAMGLEQPTKEG